MQVGDIFWADLPLANGHEQSGRRPVIVIQDRLVGRLLSTVLVVPLTTTTSAARYAGTVLVPATANNNLAADSVAMVFQLRATDRVRFGSKLGTLDQAVLLQLFQILDRLTGHP